jgi:hypothetical protein|tara:strand:- start:640 stop:810 length:171 start_codon:yes stop_codon:yes gene_type:complete
MEIQKIRKQGETKIVTIPKNSDLKIGSYVMLTKIKNPEVESTDKSETTPGIETNYK